MKKLMLICTLVLLALPARAFTSAECQSLAQRIEAANPGISPQAKFYALRQLGCFAPSALSLAECQRLAQRIEATNPDASPRVKFYALRAVGWVPG
jgi:hypothetical protein